MSTTDGRLTRLYPGLTGRERAILALEAWKEGRDEDFHVRQTMPPQQTGEFNRLIGLMNATNGDLATCIWLLRALLENLSARLGWLLSLRLWGMDAWAVAVYLFFNTKEPVTESEHRRLREAARKEMIPVKDLAEILAERYDGWKKKDYEQNESDGPAISDRAWDRLLAQKERELAGLVSEGTLTGRWRGRRLLVEAGSFYDWLHEPVLVCPDWGMGYEVFPDEQGDTVTRLKRERADARETLQNAPFNPGVEELHRNVSGRGAKGRSVQSRGQTIADAVQESLGAGIQEGWAVLAGVDRVLDEIAAEFAGQDPLLPRNRELLEDARKDLLDLHEQFETYAEPLALADPRDDLVERIRTIVVKDEA